MNNDVLSQFLAAGDVNESALLSCVDSRLRSHPNESGSSSPISPSSASSESDCELSTVSPRMTKAGVGLDSFQLAFSSGGIAGVNVLDFDSSAAFHSLVAQSSSSSGVGSSSSLSTAWSLPGLSTATVAAGTGASVDKTAAMLPLSQSSLTGASLLPLSGQQNSGTPPDTRGTAVCDPSPRTSLTGLPNLVSSSSPMLRKHTDIETDSDCSSTPPAQVEPLLLPRAGGPMDSVMMRQLLEEQGLKRKRLARKAELARESRRKKKARLDELEGEVAQLKDELAQERMKNVQLALQVQEQAKSAIQREREPPASVSPHPALANAEAIQTLLRQVVDVHNKRGPTGALKAELVKCLAARGVVLDAELGISKQATEMGLPLRFLLWSMNQNDKFYADPAGLWNSVFRQEVGLSDEQMVQLQQLRTQMQLKAEDDVDKAFEMYSEALRRCQITAAAGFNRVHSLCTTEQFTRFCSWVFKFGQWCMKISV